MLRITMNSFMAIGLGCLVGFAATVPAVVIDASTPKKAFISFLELVKSGNPEQAKAMFATPANEEEKRMLEYGIGEALYAPVLMKALKVQFPNAKLPDTDANMSNFQKTIAETWKETITGDRAVLVDPLSEDTMGSLYPPPEFVKSGNAWKLAIKPSAYLNPVPPGQEELAKARRAAYLETIAEVKAGKYKSFEDAAKAQMTKFEDIAKLFAATSRAATSKASTTPQR